MRSVAHDWPKSASVGSGLGAGAGTGAGADAGADGGMLITGGGAGAGLDAGAGAGIGTGLGAAAQATVTSKSIISTRPIINLFMRDFPLVIGALLYYNAISMKRLASRRIMVLINSSLIMSYVVAFINPYPSQP